MDSTNPVSLTKEGATALISLANPPVNALSSDVRRGLSAAIAEATGDPEIQVIAVYGKGKCLSAGADIREFGKAPVEPSLPDVLNAIEDCPKPVVAVVHGPTLGGGLELALACHARIALENASLGLPEVTLGLLPGAGGTQRLPRLVPLDTAIDMIVTGRPVDAARAAEIGLVDQIASGDSESIAQQAARDVLEGKLATWVTGKNNAQIDNATIKAAREALLNKRPLLPAPLKALDAIAMADRPIAEGLAAERAAFLDLRDSPERAGLVHAFAAERAVRRIPEASARPRHIVSVGVIGGGTMGTGIATALLIAGFAVRLVEAAEDRAEKAGHSVRANLDQALKRGKLDAGRRRKAEDALTVSVDLAALSTVDLVIEAVFEDIDVKTEIFGKLDATCKPGAILATNTSYLDVDRIAAATSRPQDVVGLHFFSPAHIMRLVEVVVGDETAPETTSTAFDVAKRMGKIAVRSGVCDGFIGNRILAHYRRAIDYLLIDGADFPQIDTAIEDYGFAMGPFAVSDLAGLDIGWATRKRKSATRPADERYVPIADRICEAGHYGRKTGHGFYIYDGKTRQPSPAAQEVVQAERAAAGISPRSFTDLEIVDRYMTAMISEAVRVLQDGIALRPVDIDAVFLFGYGFPRHLGGPLHQADRIGAAELISRIDAWAAEDPQFWQVPELLRDLAQSGGTFANMNKD